MNWAQITVIVLLSLHAILGIVLHGKTHKEVVHAHTWMIRDALTALLLWAGGFWT